MGQRSLRPGEVKSFWLEVDFAGELPVAGAIVLLGDSPKRAWAGQRGSDSAELGMVRHVEAVRLKDELCPFRQRKGTLDSC